MLENVIFLFLYRSYIYHFKKPNQMRKILIITFLVFFLINLQTLFSQVTCTASAPPQVAVGQTFTYTFKLNERAQQITSYQFPGFDALSGPNQNSTTSLSIINGQTTQTQEYSYSFTLRAKKEGNYTIPAAIFVVNGNQVKSNSVQIKVVAGQQAGTPQNQQYQQGKQNQQQQQQQPATSLKDDVFVRASASKTNPYQGEQVIITHKLYVGASVNGGYRVTNATMPTQSGLWSYTLGDPDAENVAKQEVLNGKKYAVHEIRRTAVFPQKTGEVTVTPMELEFLANVISQQSTGDPFFDRFFGGRQNSQSYKLDLKSNTVQLNVKPLPQNNKPENFSGLVGTFNLSSHLSRSQLKANDATNLTITISGTGNLQHIDPLDIIFPSDFDVPEPRVSDNINTKGNSVSGSRIFEYVIIPRTDGTFTIPPATFSYFDPNTNSYKTINTQEFKLEVEKGSGTVSVSTTSSQKDIKVLGNDIRFIKTSHFNLKPTGAAFFGTRQYYAALFLPLLLLIIFIIIWRKQIELRSDEALVRYRKANKVAKKYLKTAKKLLDNKNKELFYLEISRALWGYISDKYHIPVSQLSMENVVSKLSQLDVSTQIIEKFTETLQQCEFARFAPGDSNEIMQEMYDKATQCLAPNSNHNNRRLQGSPLPPSVRRPQGSPSTGRPQGSPLLLSAFCFLLSASFAQSPTDLPTVNYVYAEGINSVKLTPVGSEFGQPIIQLFSGERLQLSFDDLLQKDRYLKYTLVHCSHDWNYSPLSPIEYLQGFYEDIINDYSYSFNTIVPYTHYNLTFPNEQMRILKSGNYLLVVYDDNIDNPVLTRRLMVVDAQQVKITPNITWAQDLQYRSTKQQVDFTVYTGAFNIRNPSMYLHATILQNGRWDNAIEGLTYRTTRPGEIGFYFDNLNKNVFNGISDFRTFDIRTLRSTGDRIVSINFNDRINQAYVMEDLARPWGAYVTNPTLKGYNTYRNFDFSGKNTEDYVLVHFSLRCDFQVELGDLYVFGELTDWQIQPQAKLTYNPENNYWETDFYCKQGYYNYMYVFVPKGSNTINDIYIEGSHWETPNNYTILLYLQEEGTSYDKLIGVATSFINYKE